VILMMRLTLVGFLSTLLLSLVVAWPTVAQEPWEPSMSKGGLLWPEPIALPADDEIIELTGGLYQVVLDNAPSCRALAQGLTTYVAQHEGRLRELSAVLAQQAQEMTELERQALADKLANAFHDDLDVIEAQHHLALCLRSGAAQGRRRPVSRQMARFFDAQTAWIEALMGPLEDL